MTGNKNTWPATPDELAAAIERLRSKGCAEEQLSAAADSIIRLLATFVRGCEKFAGAAKKASDLLAALEAVSLTDDEAADQLSDELKERLIVFSMLFGKQPKPNEDHKYGPKTKLNAEQDLIFSLALISVAARTNSVASPPTSPKAKQVDWDFVLLAIEPLRRLKLITLPDEQVAGPGAIKNRLNNRYRAAMERRTVSN